jgi:hypothetical protein
MAPLWPGLLGSSNPIVRPSKQIEKSEAQAHLTGALLRYPHRYDIQFAENGNSQKY